jgi:hypothetical protein
LKRDMMKTSCGGRINIPERTGLSGPILSIHASAWAKIRHVTAGLVPGAQRGNMPGLALLICCHCDESFVAHKGPRLAHGFIVLRGFEITPGLPCVRPGVRANDHTSGVLPGIATGATASGPNS